MLVDKAEIFSISFVSTYNQIIARTETKGMDARIEPMRLLLLDISEITTIKIVVITIFKM